MSIQLLYVLNVASGIVAVATILAWLVKFWRKNVPPVVARAAISGIVASISLVAITVTAHHQDRLRLAEKVIEGQSILLGELSASLDALRAADAQGTEAQPPQQTTGTQPPQQPQQQNDVVEVLEYLDDTPRRVGRELERAAERTGDALRRVLPFD